MNGGINVYKLIEIYEKKTNRRVAQYSANASMSSPDLVTFYKDGYCIGMYKPQECYHIEKED